MSFVRLLEGCIVMGVRLLHCESDGPFLCLAVLLQEISPVFFQPLRGANLPRASHELYKVSLNAAQNVSAAPATTAFQRSSLSAQSIYLIQSSPHTDPHVPTHDYSLFACL